MVIKKGFLLSLLLCAFILNVNISEGRTLIVASDATWPPFEMVDENKQVVGYAPDYIKAVAAEIGMDVELRNTAWDGIFAVLKSSQCDLIASSVTITEERKANMIFTEPYFENYQAVVVNSNSPLATFDDLADKIVGGQIGTTGMLFLPKLSPKAKAQTYDDVGLAMEDLKNGRLDAVICDEFVALYYAEKNPGYAENMKIITRSTEAEYYGFALRNENTELVETLNKGIQAVKAKGIDKELVDKWLK